MNSPAQSVALLILDGFGHRDPAADNAVSLAKAPTWQGLWRDAPHTLIEASGEAVGLPPGQFGNSEVGHLNLGAGRVVYMDLTRIDHAIRTGEFKHNPALLAAINAVKANGQTLHVMGLLSSGGVHSHEAHWTAFIDLALAHGIKRIALHPFLDGRDVPPKSATDSLTPLQAQCDASGGAAQIKTICGRYYAMDRDQRWERVETAYRAIAEGTAAAQHATAAEGLAAAYATGVSDEFVPATLIGEPKPMQDGDALVLLNFRADRAREITQAFCFPDFAGFSRPQRMQLSAYTCLSFYGDAYVDLPNLHIGFRNELIENSLGEVLSKAGKAQLRLAETEKYAHVTYFFSGGREKEFTGEARQLIPSPKVATYDLQPAMSAQQVTDALIKAMQSKTYSAMIVNYANGDMVGHTGSLPAAIAAVEALDASLAQVLAAAKANGVELLITADHGNCEQMFDPASQQVHTQHTTNLVPFVYVGQRGQVLMRSGGALRDVAPTVLDLLGLPQPAAMTGRSLLG
jgi:2,3-bisphosphoglycerate-independent phosphoglycerate mutase